MQTAGSVSILLVVVMLGARLTFRFGRRDYRLTDVHGNVVKEIVA
jgi:hypothetical protein